MNKAMRDFADEAIKSKELSDANDAFKRELEDKRIHILSLETKLANRSASERNSMLNIDKLNEEIRMLKSQIDDQLGSMSLLDDKSKYCLILVGLNGPTSLLFVGN
jgi:chromosome segregation ATPase